jgi:hypothetical protein
VTIEAYSPNTHAWAMAIAVLYWLCRVPMFLLRVAARALREPRQRTPPVLCLDAGAGGWEIIEYKELLQTAVEYCGAANVRQIVIQPGTEYVREVRRAVETADPTHYCYSPRTGSQNTVRGMLEAFRLGCMFAWRGVTPIAVLSDLPVRRWRAQCAIVTAEAGVVVSLMSPRLVRSIFPHRRIVGPTIMAMSARTLRMLDGLRAARPATAHATALFTGSLYEPRTTTLNEIQRLLRAQGKDLTIRGRAFGGPRISDEQYWTQMVNAAIVVTTADQVVVPGADAIDLPHLIYRYLEATAAGVLLVAQDLPGLARYFVAGEHFVSFRSPSDAAERIAYYLGHDEERRAIAANGHARARALIESRAYWLSIDTALGRHGLT